MPQEEELELGGPIFDDGTTRVRFGNGVEKEWKKTDDSSRRGYRSRVPLIDDSIHSTNYHDDHKEKALHPSMSVLARD